MMALSAQGSRGLLPALWQVASPGADARLPAPSERGSRAPPGPRESWIPVPTAAPVRCHANFLRPSCERVKSPALAGFLRPGLSVQSRNVAENRSSGRAFSLRVGSWALFPSRRLASKNNVLLGRALAGVGQCDWVAVGTGEFGALVPRSVAWLGLAQCGQRPTLAFKVARR